MCVHVQGERARWLVDAKLHWVKAHLRLGDDLNREGMFHAGFQSSEAPHAFMRISKESATLHIPLCNLPNCYSTSHHECVPKAGYLEIKLTVCAGFFLWAKGPCN